MIQEHHAKALIQDGESPEAVAEIMVRAPSFAAYNYYIKSFAEGRITYEQHNLLELILPSLIDLSVDASSGNLAAQERLLRIKELVFTNLYPVSEWKLKQAIKPVSVSHQRAVVVFLTKHNLLPLVEPSKCNERGRVLTIKMKNKSNVPEHLKEFYELVKPHCGKKATLLSVAVKVFEELQNLPDDDIRRINKNDLKFTVKKFVCNRRTLERDIKEFKDWLNKNRQSVPEINDIVSRIERWEMNAGKL